MGLTEIKNSIYYSGLAVICCFACKQDQAIETAKEAATLPYFVLLSPDQTNVTFQNKLIEGLNTNILMYEYFYNGGGVAIGDFNGDDLMDLYFTSNMGDNKFYLNQGNMEFRDVTATSGIGGRDGPWKTGVTTVDINNDRKLDLYLCYSGALPEEKRINQLFVNQGNNQDNIPIFREEAASYGLASAAFSNQAYFLDYDRDGDMDMLLLNHNPKSLPVLNENSTREFLKKDDPLRGVRLFRQSNGKFEDITVQANISGSALTYGLGIGVSDLNNDHWPDFYVSNDYAVPDYLYLNNQDGTFTNQLSQSMGHISHFSMGNDIADVNNDGLPDIYTLDMLPEDNHRQKLLLSPDNYEKFDLNVRSGFHYQYMRNMLQLNAGNGAFQEIGQLAGISNTDWSWAALLADYNNDGWKDLFVTNGYYRDYTNLDFINYMDNYVKAKGRLKREDVLEVIKAMPSSNVINYMFSNQGGKAFINSTNAWGLDQPANSNGASFADLDNDGDLDLVVNNINLPAFIYRNQTSQLQGHHYLQIKLLGAHQNTQGLGAKVSVFTGSNEQLLEQSTSRGYLSAVWPVLHFGLGQESKVDSLRVTWNHGKSQVLYDITTDRSITLKEEDATFNHMKYNKLSPIFIEATSPIKHSNPQIAINDFKRQPLLINQLSFAGNGMTAGDLNADGLEDVLVGGGSGQSTTLFFQQKNGSFQKQSILAFEADKHSEDTELVIFDANADGHPDIYVASGGYHNFAPRDKLLQDRLYINDGKGSFSKSVQALPEMRSSTGCVAVNDINEDGFPDIFVGGRVIPGRYPEAPTSYLLINDGQGNFSNQIKVLAPELENLGMITDAKWYNLNHEPAKELILIGEWLPVSIFSISEGKLHNKTLSYFENNFNGWWNTLEVADINGDGKPDLIAGNMGTNTQFQISGKEPAELYFDDYDQNGSVDPIFCFYIQGQSFPYVTRDELLRQLVSLRSKYTSYQSYAGATINEIFNSQLLNKSKKLQANHMETTLFRSTKEGTYQPVDLPIQAQYSPVYTIKADDFNGDGHKDILMFGNNHHFKLRLGKFDANHGTLLLGNGLGKFEYLDQSLSGLDVRGEVRNLLIINNTLLLGINQEPLKSYKWSLLNNLSSN